MPLDQPSIDGARFVIKSGDLDAICRRGEVNLLRVCDDNIQGILDDCAWYISRGLVNVVLEERDEGATTHHVFPVKHHKEGDEISPMMVISDSEVPVENFVRSATKNRNMSCFISLDLREQPRGVSQARGRISRLVAAVLVLGCVLTAKGDHAPVQPDEPEDPSRFVVIPSVEGPIIDECVDLVEAINGQCGNILPVAPDDWLAYYDACYPPYDREIDCDSVNRGYALIPPQQRFF